MITSLRANGSRECVPDDRLREAMHLAATERKLDCFAPLLAETVILRFRGVSSTLRLLDSITDASEYWIARRSPSSGGHSADPLVGDDVVGCGAVIA
jgi:hypothetical protein